MDPYLCSFDGAKIRLIDELSKSKLNYLQTQGFAGAPKILSLSCSDAEKIRLIEAESVDKTRDNFTAYLIPIDYVEASVRENNSTAEKKPVLIVKNYVFIFLFVISLLIGVIVWFAVGQIKYNSVNKPEGEMSTEEEILDISNVMDSPQL